MRTPVEDVIEALAPLAGLPSPGRPHTPEMVEVWAEVLADLPLSAIRRAVMEALRRERFYPSPAVLRGYAAPQRNLATEAERVYKAIGALERYDPHRGGYWIEEDIREHLGDAAAEAHVTAGGSGARLREDDTWTRKAFAEAYAAAAVSSPAPEIPEPQALRQIAREPRRRDGMLPIAAALARALPALPRGQSEPEPPGNRASFVRGELSPAEAGPVDPQAPGRARNDPRGSATPTLEVP